MFVGHGALALAVVGLAARRAGLAPRRALALGAVAALFATAPDVDVLYAPVGLLFADARPLHEAFWGASTATHRSVTHSLLVAVPAATGFALAPRRPGVAAALLGTVVATALAVSGPLTAAVALLFVLAGAGVAALADAAAFGAVPTVAAALAGLLTHPFGDLLTGSPPPLLYPLDVALVTTRIAPFADPTLDLFLAFNAELAAVWAGVAVAVWLSGARLRDHLQPRAVLGVGFAAAVLVVPNPTVDAAYGFVAGALTTGAVGGVRPSDDLATWVVTGLLATTVAGATFAAAYLA